MRTYVLFGATAVVFMSAMASTPFAQDNWRPHLKALPANVITPAKGHV